MRTEPSATQMSRLARTDVKPIPMLSHSMSPFVSTPMVAMATQPTIVWVSYPSPPPSPTDQDAAETPDSAIKQSVVHGENETRLTSTFGSTSLTSPSNVMLPLWRPW